MTPDLRKSDPAIYQMLGEIVLGGARLGNGVPRFDASAARTSRQIRVYLLSRRAAVAAEQTAARSP